MPSFMPNFSRIIATPFFAVPLLIALSLLFFMPGQKTLQPMDRDEPRFAQATKQMLESGDYVDIRFQDEARHKKPIGIYWVQAAAVSLGEAMGVPEARQQIWLYRLPSLIGAVLVVLATYWAGLAFLSPLGAFVGALMMLACVLLGVEARLAKTDALLSASIIISMGALARVWNQHVYPAVAPRVGLANALIFWIAMGVSILIKGPIGLLVAGLAAGGLSWRERSGRWLLPLRPWLGLIITLLIVMPWLVLITIKTGGAFFEEAVGKDMLGKVTAGAEKHGAPPGLYIAIIWATFWPIAPFMALALLPAWRARKDASVLFLGLWLIPMWIVFEIVPTKLPHYVLPLYPAMAILTVLMIERGAFMREGWRAKVSAFLLALIPVAALIGTAVAFLKLDGALPVYALPLLVLAAAFSLYGARELWFGRAERAFSASIPAALCFCVAAFAFGLPKLESINLSRRLADTAKLANCANPEFATAGYREPSLVFLTSTKLLMGDGSMMASFISAPNASCRIAFVELKEEARFTVGLGDVKPQLLGRVVGVNINSGRTLDIGVWVKK